MDIYTLAAEESIRLWKQVYHRFPRATAITSILALLIGIGGISLIIRNEAQKTAEAERKRAENFSYNQQLEALNNVQGSLNNLIQFVELQKGKLKESEDLVNNLKTEQEKLKPVVEADRKTVDAILEFQAQKTQTNVSRERWIGFGLGVLSSILASLIVGLISQLRKRKRNAPSAPATA